MEELTLYSVTKLGELIRDRAISPVELIEAFLFRIEQLNPKLNAIVTLAPDVLVKAKEAETTVMRGEAVGPLHGVPLTVKDTIETAGLRTTSGSPMRADFIPEHDAPAVASLKASGAIILGKTNPAEMAMDYTADNPVFGHTNNPYDLSRTPGGSSGGEAAAIASCMSPAGLGSDLAGSIRIPSHFCGIAGFKPATTSVPAAGQFPPSAGPYSLGAAIGPMARRVEDLHLLFNLLARRQWEPSVSRANSLPDARAAMRRWRVVWYADDEVSPVSIETRNAVERAALALAEAGLVVEECRPPGLERGYDLWLKLFSRASVVQLRQVYMGHEKQGGEFVRWRLATADDVLPPTLDEYINFWMERDRLRQELLNWMNSTPLIVAPVGATHAIEHGARRVQIESQSVGVFRAFSYAQTFNVFDLPSAVVPAAFSKEGLPIGVQVIGRPLAENFVLAAAAIIEEAFGGWQPPPMFDKLKDL